MSWDDLAEDFWSCLIHVTSSLKGTCVVCIYLQLDRRTFGAFAVVSIVFSLVDALTEGSSGSYGISPAPRGLCPGILGEGPLLQLGEDGIWVW